MGDPEDVGRKLAGKIKSTRPVIYTDWITRIGLFLAQRVPYLVKKSTERFLKEHATTAGTES